MHEYILNALVSSMFINDIFFIFHNVHNIKQTYVRLFVVMHIYINTMWTTDFWPRNLAAGSQLSTKCNQTHRG